MTVTTETGIDTDVEALERAAALQRLTEIHGANIRVLQISYCVRQRLVRPGTENFGERFVKRTYELMMPQVLVLLELTNADATPDEDTLRMLRLAVPTTVLNQVRSLTHGMYGAGPDREYVARCETERGEAIDRFLGFALMQFGMVKTS